MDLKLVHRMNEFHAIYYMIGALCKLNELNFEFLEPNMFLNCYFCVNYIKRFRLKMDENDNVVENDYVRLDSMINMCEVTADLNASLKDRIEFCKKILNKNCLKDLFKNLKV